MLQRVVRCLFVAAMAAALPCLPRAAHAAATNGWSTWHASALLRHHGYPVFTVNGKPYFVYGAAFFYERIPRAQWATLLRTYKRMGVNTIDLYVIWNWHEPAEGVVDFTGRTNDRRDLRGLLRLIDSDGFKIILRPGPVIRNEWRNGGYPAWLLKRPSYDMPLRDVLEGRYPATATLQNAHADAAAAEWMSNATHLRYAAQWLSRVLREVEPWSHDVIAIALDDDQGAYLDNDTWPAPHWHAYVRWLAETVRSTAGERVPLFINTYQSKVTADAPTWAWGDWYQSDAYTIGDHDISQIALSDAMLQTQPGMPVMIGEFQAGWLQGADEVAPRKVDPTNTAIALHELLQTGARGIVNFPVQDTHDPAGWSAPWSNWSYAWDAALTQNGNASPRYAPTAAFGRLVMQWGPYLARLHAKSDLAIAWLVSAYPPSTLTHARVGAIAAATVAALSRCRALALTCRLVDLRYDTAADLAAAKRIVLPTSDGSPFASAVRTRLAAFAGAGGRTYTSVDAAAIGIAPVAGGIRDATLMVTPDGRSGMLDVINATEQTRHVVARTLQLDGKPTRVAAFDVPARGARDIPLGVPPRAVPMQTAVPHLDLAFPPMTLPRPHLGSLRVFRADVFRDGASTYVLENHFVRVVISADAGARSFVFEDLAAHRNAFASIGAFRDVVAVPATPSPRDYIAAYTHPIEAGTFNRAYTCKIASQTRIGTIRCTYDAPGLGAQPIRFEKVFSLAVDSRTLLVTERASADAASLSAVSSRPGVSVSCSRPTGCTTQSKPGYVLVRYFLPAGSDVTMRLSLQGPVPVPANQR